MLARWNARWMKWRSRFSRAEWVARHLDFSRTTEGPDAPGLLLIQIDGLARRQMERAMRAGRLPFLRKLMSRRGYDCHTFYSGQPATTPAVQAELHYGVRSAVPAFSFLDHRAGGIGRMTDPTWAKRIEKDLAAESTGLLQGGSSWSNIYTGGAAQEESHLCGASIGMGDMWRSLKLRLLFTLCIVHLDAIARVLFLMVVELAVGLWDALHGVFVQRKNIRKEFVFLVARVLVCAGMRELITFGAAIDLARGLPIIHANFLGYDEQSHRRGPDSAFAHWTLKGIDRSIRRLYLQARRAGRRHYEVWIFSDHGQTRARQGQCGQEDGLEGLVRKHWPNPPLNTDATENRPQVRSSPGAWLGGSRQGRRKDREKAESALSAFEKKAFSVAALGPVGHIYFARDIGPDATRRLAANLVRDGLPGILWRDESEGAVWLEAGGEHRLPDHHALLEVNEHLQPELARDLVAMCHNPHAGNLIALGWAPGRQSWTFASENGSHAGPSPDEVLGFALLPPATWLPRGTEHFIRPRALRQAALHSLGRNGMTSSDIKNAPTNPKSGARRDTLRIVTYNVHGCQGMDGRVSPRRIARVLAQLDADIIALQEVDVGRKRSRAEDQVSLIASELWMNACFCPVVDIAGERYGHAVLSRESLSPVRRGRLPGIRRGREPREVLWVTTQWHEREINCLGTHLGLGNSERRQQVQALLGTEWLGGLNGANPIVLCGDFNLHPGTWGYRQLTANLQDVQESRNGRIPARTFPSSYPVRRIDHIFVSEHFVIETVAVPHNELTAVASDHLPVVTDLRWATP